MKAAFKEYDIVKADVDLSNNVSKDCKGTILMIYPDFPFTYEVEFIDDNCNTLDVLTVRGHELTQIL